MVGMVNAVPEFEDHPMIVNDWWGLFVKLVGKRGRHARLAVGIGSLPMQIAVEVEVLVEGEG